MGAVEVDLTNQTLQMHLGSLWAFTHGTSVLFADAKAA
jgi:hypothetical protein